MNKKETVKILAVLQAAYPSFYKNIGNVDLEGIANLWTEMFANDTYEAVGTAVKMLIATKTNTFPPAIGEIKEQLYKAQYSGQMSEGEAWGLVFKAIQCGIYNSKEAFEWLPEDVQRAVGSSEVIRQWAIEDVDSLSVHESNFKRAYRMRLETKKEMDMLPSALKKQIELLAERKRGLLDDGGMRNEQISQPENGD